MIDRPYRNALAYAFALALPLVGGCDNQAATDESAIPEIGDPAIGDEGSTAEPEAEEPTAEAFPIPEDFEDEATTSISADNLEAELAALEAELDAAE